jgi:hypothetical protein
MSILQQELQGHSSALVLQALQSVNDAEQVWEAIEHRELDDKQVAPDSPGAEIWSRRPRTVAYCGLAEGNNTFLVSELKNAEQDCSDRKPRSPASCSSCAHNAPTGTGAVLDRLQEIMEEFLPAGPGAFQQVRQDYDAYIAVHLRLVEQGDGVVATAPSFLPVCRAFSEPGRAVISVLRNRTNQCQGFTEGAASPPDALVRLIDLYVRAKSGTVGWGRVANDPVRLAMCDFIDAALRYLGLGASAPTVLMQLKSAVNAEATAWAQGAAHFAR